MPETYNSDGVECPYCGYVNDDMEQVADQDLETIECPECEKTMYAQAEISWVFTARERGVEDIQQEIKNWTQRGENILEHYPKKKINPYQHKIVDLEKELEEIKKRV